MASYAYDERMERMPTSSREGQKSSFRETATSRRKKLEKRNTRLALAGMGGAVGLLALGIGADANRVAQDWDLQRHVERVQTMERYADSTPEETAARIGVSAEDLQNAYRAADKNVRIAGPALSGEEKRDMKEVAEGYAQYFHDTIENPPEDGAPSNEST